MKNKLQPDPGIEQGAKERDGEKSVAIAIAIGLAIAFLAFFGPALFGLLF